MGSAKGSYAFSDSALVKATFGNGKKKNEVPPYAIPDAYPKVYKSASDYCGKQPNDPSPICYLAGSPGKERKFLRMTGTKFRLYSWLYSGWESESFQRRQAEALDIDLISGVRCVIDSGAHTYHKILHRGTTLRGDERLSMAARRKRIEQLLELHAEKYARWLKWAHHNGRRFDWYATIDAHMDCEFIYAMTKRLARQYKIWAVPVYHGDSELSWVQRYIDEGHTMIGVSLKRAVRMGSRYNNRRYFESVVNYCDRQNVSTHGFAVTGSMMFDIPFTSCDSITYLTAAKYGKILEILPHGTQRQIHVSEWYAKTVQYGNLSALASGKRRLRDLAEKRGFDFDDLTRRDGQGLWWRSAYNAKVLLEAVQQCSEAKRKYRVWNSVLTDAMHS